MRTELIRQLHAVASPQLGLITNRQADAIGMTPAMRRNAIARGWICRERRGVYVLAGQPPSAWRSIYAAVLAAGPEAAISHTSAARIHAIYGIAGSEIELTLPGHRNPLLADVRAHRSKTIVAGDLQERRGVLITSPVRTIIDVADRYHEPLLGKIVDEGAIARLWTPESVLARINQFRAIPPHLTELRRVLAARTGEGQPDSALEQRVFRIVKRAFPGYVIHFQVVLDGQLIIMDIAWPKLRIDAEVDGIFVRTTSSSKFEHERRRQNILGRNGWRIIHLTASMDDHAIVAELAPLFHS
jgi:very-short-patch-repair endonuclease